MGDTGLARRIGSVPLVDHHTHPVVVTALTPEAFGDLITESDRPAPPGASRFDSQAGFAIRRWCGPVLGLPPSASAEEYLARRAETGPAEAARLLLRASGIGHYLIDTGYQLDGMADLGGMAELAGAAATEVVRLEQVAEQAATGGDGTAAGLAARIRAALWERTAHACGVKSIIAYRFGLDFDPEPPSPAEVTAAAGRWLREISGTGRIRVSDPVLLRHVLWAGVERGLPVQFHTGFGDPDADVRRCDPLLLRGFCELTQDRNVPLMMLHCYPYHRQAGYLAHAYPHVYLDVGLALNYVGARAATVVAESLELAPFGKVLFSSDAYALPELHYLGALLWRRAMTAVLEDWVAAGDWSEQDAVRVAELTGAANARHLYRLS
jgi:uncharacterized protein